MQKLAFATLALGLVLWTGPGPPWALVAAIACLAAMCVIVWFWSLTPRRDPERSAAPDDDTDLQRRRIVALDVQLRQRRGEQ